MAFILSKRLVKWVCFDGENVQQIYAYDETDSHEEVVISECILYR